jgi:hypothetical protein
MITSLRRAVLGFEALQDDVVGYDCLEQLLRIDDDVEVKKQDRGREGNPAYEYCGVGERGKITGKYPIHNGNYFVMVRFKISKRRSIVLSCIDYYLRKI